MKPMVTQTNKMMAVKKQMRMPSMPTIIFSLAFSLILATGLYLRLASIGSAPILEDEYTSAFQALGIMNTGRPTLPSGFIQWSEPLVIPYIVSALWQMTGVDIITARLLSVIVGTSSVFLAYLMGKRLHNTSIGLVFAFFIATNQWSVASSTFFRSYALAEFAFLAICYIGIRWIDVDRSLRGYLIVIAATLSFMFIGHYALIVALPSVLALPAISKLCDIINRRIDSRPLTGGSTKSWGMMLNIRIDLTIVEILLYTILATAAAVWIIFEQGSLAVSLIGNLTGEFFTVLPHDTTITFKPMFAQAFYDLYGPWLLFLIGFGTLIMLVQTGRRGLTIMVYFIIPVALFSTLFSSLTITTLFPRYVFPYNPALLLALSFTVVYLSEIAFRQLRTIAPKRLRFMSSKENWLPALICAIGIATVSSSLLLRIDVEPPAPSMDKWFRGPGEPITPAYNKVTDYIRTHMSPNDVILATRGWPFPFEFPELEGFWLMSVPLELSELGDIEKDRLTNRFTGYEAVTNLSAFLTLLEEEASGWVVIPYMHDSPHVMTPPVYDIIHTRLIHIPAASDTTISLFQWNADSVNLTPFTQKPEPYGNTRSIQANGNNVTMSSMMGPLNWAGIRYDLQQTPLIQNLVFDVHIKLDQMTGSDAVQFNFILEEDDGDRWHVPDYTSEGYLPVRPTGNWHRFSLRLSEFDFWPQFQKMQEPGRIKYLKIEAQNAENISFTAQIKVSTIAVDPTS
jgi:4-amino-4-deoxy-L-arabinose transferase-like glycosyltransferase